MSSPPNERQDNTDEINYDPRRPHHKTSQKEPDPCLHELCPLRSNYRVSIPAPNKHSARQVATHKSPSRFGSRRSVWLFFVDPVDHGHTALVK
jgi:hypothetical protein